MKSKLYTLSIITLSVLILASCAKTSGYTDLGGQILKQYDVTMATTNQNHVVTSPYSSVTMNLQILDNKSINYEVFVEKANKAGDYVTAVEINLGDPSTASGPLLVSLIGKFRQGWATGITSGLRASLVDTLLNNNIPKYINVKTTKEPLGLVRGQINADIVISNNVYLAGTNFTPPVSTSSTGLAAIRITSDKKLYSQVVVNDSPSDPDPSQNATLMSGSIGVTGTTILTLVSSPTNFNKSQTFNLTDKQYEQLLIASYYVSVNSVARPNGKIGGQVR